MFDASQGVQAIRAQIDALECQLHDLKQQLAIAEKNVDVSHNPSPTAQSKNTEDTPALHTVRDWRWPLEGEEYNRYGRQMIMPEIGLHGQLNLKHARVLVIGLGGLGCPAAVYLAGAGVGTIGLVDGDIVELSNLHRQILHSTGKVGQLKVESALDQLRQLNPKVNYVAHPENLISTTALDIFQSYDLILDCTDHPTSRYLISDAAVLSRKPLVSASALRTEGQLMVLNNPPNCSRNGRSGPCYRCIFPKPPPAESVTGCGEGGILGPVVGVMGVLMALEAIKVITCKTAASDKETNGVTEQSTDEPATMLLFSAYSNPPFRNIRLRGKRPRCMSCSAKPAITEEFLRLGTLDYTIFCGTTSPVCILGEDERISAKDLGKIWREGATKPLILDVRDKVQYDICHLEGSINIPYPWVESSRPHEAGQIAQDLAMSSILSDHPSTNAIYVLCRFGNDSQLAVRQLKELGIDEGGKRWVGDVRGGLRAWRQDVDPQWPEY